MSGDLIPRVQQLRSAFDGLRTFAEVARWDASALNAAHELHQAIEQTRLHQQGLSAQADQLARDRAMLPFVKRLFAGRGPERALRAQAQQVEHAAENLGTLMNDLLECIDYTPNDEKERKALLKELRAEKKDLLLQKREIAAQKREINRAAREDSANAGRFLFMYDSKMAASERRQIRRRRIGELAPYENARTLIDRQINDLDRRIMWVERFGAD